MTLPAVVRLPPSSTANVAFLLPRRRPHDNGWANNVPPALEKNSHQSPARLSSSVTRQERQGQHQLQPSSSRRQEALDGRGATRIVERAAHHPGQGNLPAGLALAADDEGKTQTPTTSPIPCSWP